MDSIGGSAGASLLELQGELLQRTLSGELKLSAEGIYDLGDAAQAAAASLQPGRKGKILLKP